MAQQILGTAVKALAKAAMKKKAKSPMTKKAAVAAGASNETRSVRKVPRKTAPATGLENRGARPTGAQRKERALDYEFDKVERFMDAQADSYYGGGSKFGANVGRRSLRKAAAVKKEGRRKVINSQQNLSKAQKSGANKKALKAANKKRRGR